MDPITLTLTALIAAGATAGALKRESNEVVWSAIGTLAWVVAGLGATNVEVFSNGEVFVRSYPGLAFVALALAVVNIVVLLVGTAYFMDVRDPETARDPPV